MSARTELKKNRKVDTNDDACEVNVVDARKVTSVRRKMHSADAVQLLAETFRVLGDATRVKIVFALSKEELCVCDLATIVGASQSAVSHSLRALRQMDLVRYRKQGKIAYYSLDDEHIGRLIDEGFDHVRELV
ncbi:MAG TPA: metalloregulator ArsR/SmtB family transcription factor [Thermoanaerobaculia bacterium]|nr:metalloregulator ArsR/SmtB family transcription factor [Thermoanaerobaculia bacterium]